MRKLLIGHGEIGERLLVQHHAAQIRDGGVQFFGRFVNALDEAGRRARDFLQVERRLGIPHPRCSVNTGACWPSG